jgi:hypothetical protein
LPERPHPVPQADRRPGRVPAHGRRLEVQGG